MPGQPDQFREYLERRLRETGVTMRQLSLAIGRDQSYFRELLAARSDRPRTLPTPDELQIAAPRLRVPLIELLEQTWGIDRAKLEAELSTMTQRDDEDAVAWRQMTEEERDEVRTFIAFVRARREMRRPTSASEANDG